MLNNGTTLENLEIDSRELYKLRKSMGKKVTGILSSGDSGVTIHTQDGPIIINGSNIVQIIIVKDSLNNDEIVSTSELGGS